MKTKFLKRVLWLMIPLLTIFTTNAWGAETLKTTCVGTGSGYGTRRTATYNSIGWVLSTGQSGYLGTNKAANHSVVVPTNADLPVVKAQYASATTSTTGYYFYYTSTAIANVTKIEFSYTGKDGSSTVQAYIVSSSTAASSGSATWSKPTLASGTGLSTQGTNIASATGTYTFKLNAKETSSKYYGIILKTGSYSRLTAGSIKIYVDDAAASKTLSSIAITTQPTTRKYLVGETFSKTGAVVTATYSDATTANVSTSATWTPTGALTAGTGKTVTASYTEGGVTKTATTTIDVYSVTVQKKDEDGTTISDAGVSASATGRTLTASAGSTNYVFKTWKYGTASGTSIASATSASTSLTGTPSAAVTVIAEFYKPITVTWMNNGTQHTTNTAARGSKPIFPSTPSACDGTSTTFIGWTQTPWDGKIAQSAVDAKTTDATKVCTSPSSMPNVTAAVTYHAVFAKGGSFSKITTSGEFTSGKYLVVNTAAAKAMKATIYSEKYLTATGVTISGTSISSAADNLIWQVSKNSSIYTFYNASAGKYAEIVADGSYGKMSLESSSQGYTAAVDGSGNWTLSSQNISGQLIRYNNTYVEFQAYNATDANKVIQLYKQAFSDYLTTCCTPHTISKAGSPAGTVTGGTFSTSVASACEGIEVTLNATPSSSAYKFGGWTITNGSSTDITTTVLGAGHAGDNPATMTMPNEAVTVNATFVSLSSIAVQTPPTKTAYLEGETFDPTGLVITRTYSNSTSDTYTYAGHTAEFTFSPTTATALTTSNTAVTITYGGQSVSQSINVYSVTVNKVKDTGGEIDAATVTATWTVGTKTLTAAVGATQYRFKEWAFVGSNNGLTITDTGNATTTVTGTPTGNVTINGVFYAPRNIVWKVNGETYSAGGSARVAYNTEWSALTLPTNPTPPCGDKFVGWTTVDIGSVGRATDAGLDLMTNANKSGKTGSGHQIQAETVTFYAVFADYVE